MTPAYGACASFPVQVCAAGEQRDVEIVLTANDVSLAEVFGALGLPADATLDDRCIETPGQTRASDVLVPGMRLAERPDDHTRDQAVDGSLTVATVAGLDAGPSVELSDGLHRVDDLFVRVGPVTGPSPMRQPWHLAASTTETVDVAGGVLALTDSVDVEAGRSRAVHRPARVIAPTEVVPIELNDGPPRVPPPSPLSWATLLAPVPIALAMALFFRPIFALFAAMGPIMAVGRWYESRRRHRRMQAERRRALAGIAAQLRGDTIEQAEAIAQLRWLQHPHVTQLWKRASANSVRLWERRPNDADFLKVAVGVAPDHVRAHTTGTFDADVHSAVANPLTVRPVPHAIDLNANSGIGLHGDRSSCLAVARSIVLQLTTLHGPADVRIGVVCRSEDRDAWDWMKWLPHTSTALSGDTTSAAAAHLAAQPSVQPRSVRQRDDDLENPVHLMLVDDHEADVAALCRAAKQAGRPVRVLAVAADAMHVPAACSSLVAIEGDAAEVATPQLMGRRTVVTPIGIAEETAADWARALARVIDPEADDIFQAGQQQVGLLRLLGATSPTDLADRWTNRAVDADPVATLGVSTEGPFRVNLTTDGPHMLVAGTTGSGKSELLRTFVVSLAADCPPDQLHFVLIDFKGGGAFDIVRELPHVAGVITDLDESLVERAVHSLRLELQRREVLFRELAVSDVRDAARASSEALPRLVVVIDEFAALATDHGELLAAIIDLAARGRSLGIHLVLATQRPNGVIDQKIRANTNLRIALRVQDSFDSQDVLGVPDAASIDRSAPGRAFVGVGSDSVVAIQTAFTGARDVRASRYAINPYRFFQEDQTCEEQPRDEVAALPPTELAVLVEAITTAGHRRGSGASRLWSEPLPASVDWIDLGSRELADADASTDAGVVLGLVDDPDRQRQAPWRWRPDSGALLIYGASASCAGKVMVSLGAALTSRQAVDESHIYVIDGGSGTCAPLEKLSAVGSYVELSEVDRIERVVRMFERELDRRRTIRELADEPRLVLLIDNVAAILGVFDSDGSSRLVDRLAALARDGAPRRLHLVLAARAVRDVGHRLAQQIPNRLALDLAEPSAYLTLGLKASEVMALPAMRAIDIETRCAVQLVEPPDLSTWPSETIGDRLPVPVRAFPSTVDQREVGSATIEADGTIRIPLGIAEANLEPVALRLRPGEHALVASSPGMGGSAVALLVAEQLGSLCPDAILRIGSSRSALLAYELPGRLVSEPEQLDDLVLSLDHDDGGTPVFVIVDDADLIADEMAAALAGVIERRLPNCHVVAVSSLEAARSIRSWTTPLRLGGTGLVLGGQVSDGDLFRCRFRRLDGLGVLPGRGHLIVRGQATALQVARPNVPT